MISLCNLSWRRYIPKYAVIICIILILPLLLMAVIECKCIPLNYSWNFSNSILVKTFIMKPYESFVSLVTLISVLLGLFQWRYDIRKKLISEINGLLNELSGNQNIINDVFTFKNSNIKHHDLGEFENC